VVNEKSRGRLDDRREEILDPAITGVETKFPEELTRFALLLTVLLFVGVVFPLAVLEAPDLRMRILLPLIVCFVTCPGRFDLDMLVVGEQRGQPLALLVGEQV
jgi:hypothetical protein